MLGFLEQLALTVAVTALIIWWITRSVMKRISPPGVCVACGSTDLDVLAPGVYRCRACGYEGGENRGKMEADAARLAWEKRPWPERIAAARTELLEAKRQLEAMEADVDKAQKSPEPMLAAGYPSPFFELVVHIQAAGAKVSDAAEKVPGLGVPVFADVKLDMARPDDVVQAYAAAVPAVTAALAAVEAMADAGEPEAGDASATNAAAKVDPA